MQDHGLQGMIGGGAVGMAYAPKAAPPKPSIATDLDLCIKRLHALCERLDEVGHAVTGPVPIQAQGGNSEMGRPITSLASRDRDIGDLIGRAELAASRVSEAL